MAYATDTPVTHIDHLRYLNEILPYADVTHIGDPDSHLLSPCSIHGYRVIYSARPKLDWTRPMTGHNQYQPPTTNRNWGDSRYLETVWQWSDSAGGDRPEWFTHQQRNNMIGSWVLASGATGGEERYTRVGQHTWTGGDTPPPTDATSKWWVTSQNDLTTPQAENPGGISQNIVGWTRQNQNSTRGLGEATDLPGRNQIIEGGASNVWWILYGNREILGFTECTEDHIHGHEKNWSATQINDPNIFNPVVTDGQSVQGGMTPELIFYGGDVHGVKATAQLDTDGNITGARITDPGASVITDGDITAPSVAVSMPSHYGAFDASVTVSTDKDEIMSTYPSYFKTAQQIRAELCDGYRDPIAQTFNVQGGYSDGIFVDSVDLCFGNKPGIGAPTAPHVTLELRPTVNGQPSSDLRIEASVVVKQPHQVNVADALGSGIRRSHESPLDSSTTSGRLPSFSDENAYTRFKFDHPIYLSPETEYAIVVYSNSNAYECWYADINGIPVRNFQTLSESNQMVDRALGTYTNQIGGSFFRSQNGRTWSENQEQDLMFRVNKCVWNGASPTAPNTGIVEVRAGDGLDNKFTYDRLKVSMGEMASPGTATEITSTLSTTPENGTLTNYTSFSEGSFFGDDSDNKIHDLPQRMELAASRRDIDASFKGTFTLKTKNREVAPFLDTSRCYIVPIKNKINNGELSANNINITGVGAGFTEETVKFTVGGGGSTSNATFTVRADEDGYLMRSTLKLDSSQDDSGTGSGFHTSDTEVYQIDGDDPSTAATFEILSEEGAHGGNSQQRYMTKPITLAPGMSARAVRVFLSAIKSPVSDIYVYFRAKSESDSQSISRKKWQLLNQTVPTEDSVDHSTVSRFYRQYQFDTDEIISYQTTNDGTGSTQTFDDFRTFEIKVVCQTQNTTRPPIIKDLRAIAVY